jgi:hypothetical protein
LQAFKDLGKKQVIVPKAPSGVSLRKDMAHIDMFPDWAVWIVLGSYYWPNSKWDWKDEGLRDFGNFHYGAMMAFLGLSLDETYYWAGMAEWWDGGKRDPKNTPATGFPYGESWETLYWVRMGWWYYHHYLKKK